MTTVTEEMYFANDIVDVVGRGRGRITKVTSGKLPYHVDFLEGTGVRAAAVHLTKVTGPEADELRQQLFTKAMEASAGLKLGAVVTHAGRDGYWVVIKSPAEDGRTNIAPLGGDNNKYLRTHAENVTLVPEFKLVVTE